MKPIENLIKGIETIRMYRINHQGHRLYATPDPVRIYAGLTGSLEAATFKGNNDGKRLNKWRESMINSFGQQLQEAYVNTTADFGTLCHEVLVRIWEHHSLNWEQEKDYARHYFKQSAIENNLIPNDGIIEKQVFEFCKAAASLMYFVNEQVIQIYAVEAMAKSDALQIATPLDVVYEDKKGKICQVNIKTSGQITDKHREQVVMERFMWNQTYDLKIEKTGVMRIKDWNLKKEPTYELEFVGDEILDNIISRLQLCKDSAEDTYLKFPKEQLVFAGATALGEQPKLEIRKIEDVIFEPEKELL